MVALALLIAIGGFLAVQLYLGGSVDKTVAAREVSVPYADVSNVATAPQVPARSEAGNRPVGKVGIPPPIDDRANLLSLLEAKIESYERDLQQSRDEADRLNEQIKGSDRDLQRSRDEADRLREKTRASERDLQQSRDEADRLRDQIRDHARDLQGAKDEANALREQIKGTERELQRSKVEADGLRVQVQTLSEKERTQSRQLQDLEAKNSGLEGLVASLSAERDDFRSRLEFINTQDERLKSGFPSFLSLGDMHNPLTEFWIRTSKAAPQPHSRLEGALRSYKIASDDPVQYGSKIFELVNDIGLQLYALMDSVDLDESQKREEAAKWQAALNKDGTGRFMVSVLWAGTPVESLQMMRKDQRCRSERISHVRSWVVKDKDGRIARRAIVE